MCIEMSLEIGSFLMKIAAGIFFKIELRKGANMTGGRFVVVF